MHSAYSLIAIFLFATAAPAAEQASVPDYIGGEQRIVILKWLTKHPNFRLALDEDCRCQESIKAIRSETHEAWEPIPDYHPYYMPGDFNNDESQDVAIVVVEKANRANSMLVVFNGPLGQSQATTPAFASSKLSGALFYGAPRPEPFRLVIGAFNSEGIVLEPKVRTYEPDKNEK